MKSIRFCICLLFTNAIGFATGYGQNMQYADLFMTADYPVQISLNDEEDLVYTSSRMTEFGPDRRNPNYSIQQSNDAFVICQDRNGNYKWHVQLTGEGSESIQHIWTLPNSDFVVLLRSSCCDTLKIVDTKQEFELGRDSIPNSGARFYLLKFDKNGGFKQYQNMGNENGIFYSPLPANGYEISMVISASKSVQIPGTTDSIFGGTLAYRHAQISILSSNLTTINVKHFSSHGGQSALTLNNTISLWNLQKPTGGSDSTDRFKLYFNYKNGLWKDSLSGSRDAHVFSATSVNDTLYAILGSYFIYKDTICYYNGEKFITTGLERYLTKWVGSKLIESQVIHPDGGYRPEYSFYLTAANQLFFVGTHIRQNSDSLISIRFLRGSEHLFDQDCIFFWGPIKDDSLEWTSHIGGNRPPSEYYPKFTASTTNQFISQSVNSWVDFDPGPYAYQYNPFTYQGRSVVAKYNCYPNAIFTIKQTAQKIEFINQSAGSDSFKWDFGVISKPMNQRNPVFYYPATGEYWVQLIAYNQCGSDTFRFPVYIESVLAVDEIATEVFKIYPNPFSDFIKIENIDESFNVQLFDLNGKSLGSLMLNSNGDYNIDFMSSGTYILRIVGNEHTYTKLIYKR